MFPFRLIAVLLIASLQAACSAPQRTSIDHDALAREITALAADDQRLDMLVVNSDPKVKEPGFFEQKRRLQIERTTRIKEMFDQIGFPTPPKFDKEVTSDFWLLVQHSDNDPAFQQRVLDAMDALPAGVIETTEQAYLVDRVLINTGRLQRYGTQVDFDFDQARAFPKPVEDPAGIDERRASAGLESLSKYMNGMSEMNYMMNQGLYETEGITQPWVYPAGYSDW